MGAHSSSPGPARALVADTGGRGVAAASLQAPNPGNERMGPGLHAGGGPAGPLALLVEE